MPVGERAQRRVRFRSVVSPTVTSPYAASDFFSPRKCDRCCLHAHLHSFFRRVLTVVVNFFFPRNIVNLKTEKPTFIEKEREYRFLAVFPESLDEELSVNPAVFSG
ncbi:hypothetical protein AAHE18_06G151100 [Arachis hypogaea]